MSRRIKNQEMGNDMDAYRMHSGFTRAVIIIDFFQYNIVHIQANKQKVR